MNNTVPRGKNLSAINRREHGLTVARWLAAQGMPIFLARLAADSDPIPPRHWQDTAPGTASYRAIEAWRPGMALCGVCGIVFDVLDIDPRNGGNESFEKLSDILGDNGPKAHLKVGTRSGGQHVYIACLGIGSHTGFMPGLDLKGGMPDGESRGFVFLPPTERESTAEEF